MAKEVVPVFCYCRNRNADLLLTMAVDIPAALLKDASPNARIFS